MMDILDGTGRAALLLNLGLAVAVALGLNGVIFWNGRGMDAPVSPVLIGTVWVVLFGLLGLARWRLNREASAGWLADRRRGPQAWTARQRVDLLLVNCALFPAYTLGLSNRTLGLAGVVLTLVLACLALVAAWRACRSAAALIVPVVIWAAGVTFVDLLGLHP